MLLWQNLSSQGSGVNFQTLKIIPISSPLKTKWCGVGAGVVQEKTASTKALGQKRVSSLGCLHNL